MSVPTMLVTPKNLLFSSGLHSADNLYYQFQPDELVSQCLERKEGLLSDTGALVIDTGHFTGRSPKDRFIVKDKITESTVNWNDFNQPIEDKYFDKVYREMIRIFARKTTVDQGFLCMCRSGIPVEYPGDE